MKFIKIILSLSILIHGLFAWSEEIPSSQQPQCTLIYTVSPFMPLSLGGLEEMRGFALLYHWPLKAVFDPYLAKIDAQYKKEAAQFYALNQNELTVFSQNGFFNHYPAYFIQKSNGEIFPLRFGYISSIQLPVLINTRQNRERCSTP